MMSLRFLFIIEGILFRCLLYMDLQRIFMLFHNLSSLFWEVQFRREEKFSHSPFHPNLYLYGQRSGEGWQRDSEGGGGGEGRRTEVYLGPSWSVRRTKASRKVVAPHKHALRTHLWKHSGEKSYRASNWS